MRTFKKLIVCHEQLVDFAPAAADATYSPPGLDRIYAVTGVEISDECRVAIA